ncbi:hypothetical protein BDV97DRAFT_6697 [Delphinella strobiligena]|nr:hypothetical protein BDV97DRAFT_6697 [Delphinella strobiligena]
MFAERETLLDFRLMTETLAIMTPVREGQGDAHHAPVLFSHLLRNALGSRTRLTCLQSTSCAGRAVDQASRDIKRMKLGPPFPNLTRRRLLTVAEHKQPKVRSSHRTWNMRRQSRDLHTPGLVNATGLARSYVRGGSNRHKGNSSSCLSLALRVRVLHAWIISTCCRCTSPSRILRPRS